MMLAASRVEGMEETTNQTTISGKSAEKKDQGKERRLQVEGRPRDPCVLIPPPV